MIIREPLGNREPLILAQPDHPFWGFAEVLGIAALFLPSLYIGLILVNSITKTFRFTLPQGIVSVLAELVGYTILIRGALAAF